jgi:predicted enzyme related to lactoylglutathione lyase
MGNINILKAVPYIKVNNLAKEVDFYTNVLGYEIGEELFLEDGERFFVTLHQRRDSQEGGSTVMLSSLKVHGRKRLIWLYVEDVDAAYDVIVKAGGKPLWEPRDEEHGNREFLVESLEGHVYVVAENLNK